MSAGVVRIPAEWLDEPLWNEGPFDRFHALVDLQRLADEAGELVASLDQLAGRWSWGRKRVRVFLRQLLERGVLRLAGRSGRRNRYTLAEPQRARSGASKGHGLPPEKKGLPPNRGTVGARKRAHQGPGGVSAPGAGASKGRGLPFENKGDPPTRGTVRGRQALLSLRREEDFLSKREKEVAARASPDPSALAAVWWRFLEVRRRCLEGIGQEVGPCELTVVRAVKVVEVMDGFGREAVTRALENLPFSHWHCGTGKFEGEGPRLVPEAVFRANQVEILLGSRGPVPVWEQVSSETAHYMWLNASAWPAPEEESLPCVEAPDDPEPEAEPLPAAAPGELQPCVETPGDPEPDSATGPARPLPARPPRAPEPRSPEPVFSLAEMRERNPRLWKGITGRLADGLQAGRAS